MPAAFPSEFEGDSENAYFLLTPGAAFQRPVVGVLPAP